MSFGLIVNNSDGSIMFNTSNRITRHITSGSFALGAGASLSVSVPGLVNDSTWSIVILSNDGAAIADYSISANVLTLDNFWNFTNNGQYVVFRL